MVCFQSISPDGPWHDKKSFSWGMLNMLDNRITKNIKWKKELTSHTTKHKEQSRIQESERQTKNILVYDSGKQKYTGRSHTPVLVTQQIYSVTINVSVQPIVHDHIPHSIIARKWIRVPPVLRCFKE